MAKKKAPKAKSGKRYETGRVALRSAWEEWADGEALRNPRDTSSRHVAEVLQALIFCTSQPDDRRRANALAAMAKEARAVAGGVGRPAGPELIDWLESVLATPSDLAPEAVLIRLRLSALFGEPTTNALERIRAAFRKHQRHKDAESAIVDILEAYGCTRSTARNQLKFRDMRLSRKTTSAR